MSRCDSETRLEKCYEDAGLEETGEGLTNQGSAAGHLASGYIKKLSDGGANVQSCVNDCFLEKRESEQTGGSGRQRKKDG